MKPLTQFEKMRNNRRKMLCSAVIAALARDARSGAVVSAWAGEQNQPSAAAQSWGVHPWNPMNSGNRQFGYFGDAGG